MKKFSLFLICSLLFIFFLPKVSFASQNYPMPGMNCGLANDPDSNLQQCCYSRVIDNLTLDPNSPDIANLPIGLSQIVQGAVTVVNGLIDKFPFPFGGGALPLPTIGNIKKMLKETPLCVKGNPIGDPERSCVCKEIDTGVKALEKFCDNISNNEEKVACQSCALGVNPITKEPTHGGVWTSVGCLRTSAAGFVQDVLLRLGIGLGGLASLICIIISAISLQTSEGNPEKIKKARDSITSCFIGLILIIFSVFILRVIGIDILRIPGLSF